MSVRVGLLLAHADDERRAGTCDARTRRTRLQHGFCLHVDAAFALLAACSPDLAHLLKGIAFPASIAVAAHKWLNVPPYASAVPFTRHKAL
jgi:glutamate/tyrosine decarboxylase-like PLP-dependent enzyme